MKFRKSGTVVAAALALAACGGGSVKTDALDVRVTSPNGNVSILAGDSIELRARFADGPGEVTPDSMEWKSSLSGQWMPPTNPGAVALQTGKQVITASGAFAGKRGSDSVEVTVGNIAVAIRRPGNLSHAAVGAIDFRAEAFDGNVTSPIQLVSSTTPGTGERTATFVWSSSLDGEFASGDTVSGYTGLREGKHIITLTVTDSSNAAAPVVGTASIKLVVNTPPAVSISSPDCTNGLSLAAGTKQDFTGRANDSQDGPLEGVWIDTLTGTATPGDSFAFQSTTLGRHDVVFSATDSLGDTSQVTCPVTVYPAGGAVADLFPDTTQVNADLPGSNTQIHYIGNDGAGRTIVGTQAGLAVFDGTPALVGAYGGTALLGVAVNPTVGAAVVAGGQIVVATNMGLVSCAYVNGLLSACNSLDTARYQGVAATGDLAGTGLLAAAGRDGLYLASYASGAPTAHTFAMSANDVAFAGNTLFVATSDGLCVVDDVAAAIAAQADSPCSTTVTRDTSILPTDNVRSLAVSGDALWMGTGNGLVRYSPATGGMAVFDEHDGLAASQVSDVTVDAGGIVWAATEGGVSRFDPETFSFTTLRGQDWGGSSDVVTSIYVDGNDIKWFGTGEGVVRYIGA